MSFVPATRPEVGYEKMPSIPRGHFLTYARIELAAILLVVAHNMGEWREIPELLKLSRFESTGLVTFLLTVFADLTVAVEAGMILAALVHSKSYRNYHCVRSHGGLC